MAARIPSKRALPIVFAHRGASAVRRENTLDAFTYAIELGADGLESDVWVSADGHAILDHDGRASGRLRRTAIASVARHDLPAHMPTIDDLFGALDGADFEFSVDIKDPAAVVPTVEALRRASEFSGRDVAGASWLCHPDLELLTTLRSRFPDVRLVHSTRLARLPAGPEVHAAQLYELGIDAVNFRDSDWTGGLTTLYHRFDLFCFGWDAQVERVARELYDMGIDGVFGDHVDRLVAARAEVLAAD